MYNHQLDAFIKVADLGSFSKAAEAMYISSPAILQQINLLEEKCGFKLFERSNHGVKLTPAGKSLYNDSKTLISFSNNILNKAKSLAKASDTTVRIGTSLLYKCRLLPDIWAQISDIYPELKIEILPMTEYQSRNSIFSSLGKEYDVWEGIYGSISWKGKCNFLKLKDTPVCCAFSPKHPYTQYKKITLNDLKDETLVMPIEGVSKELDRFRHELVELYPDIKIIDSSHYGVDTFTLCEVNQYILITQEIYKDIHTNLIMKELDTNHTLPYGLIYALEPTVATKKMIEAVKKLYLK